MAEDKRRVSRVTIRNSRTEDIDALCDLQKRTYPSLRPWARHQWESQIAAFPQGQLVAELKGRIVGLSSSFVVLWDDYGLDHDWRSVTGGGTFSTHNMQGRTLYGAEVCVDGTVRRQGIGRAIYRARRQLCRAMNLKRIIAAGRLPGYHQYAEEMSAELYAMKVVWGDLADPTLRFQISEGFQFCSIIPHYLHGDEESCDYAALIVWLNTGYDPSKPTQLPPPDLFGPQT